MGRTRALLTAGVAEIVVSAARSLDELGERGQQVYFQALVYYYALNIPDLRKCHNSHALTCGDD